MTFPLAVRLCTNTNAKTCRKLNPFNQNKR